MCVLIENDCKLMGCYYLQVKVVILNNKIMQLSENCC